ncbi:MAG TPA: DUF1801 domain-containing protein [Cytophagales bacterium]|nr:DUF1801 domain-containing protein [Cytophagales bacterium]
MTASALQYIESLPEHRREVISQIRETLLSHLPKGFEETINYGMLAYVVPHSLYPGGYHCDPKLPLPFIIVASQKNFIAIYHMGLYAEPSLMDWFTGQWSHHSSKKLDMGKSCMRFKKAEDVPLRLIGALAEKVSPDHWVAIYESVFKK